MKNVSLKKMSILGLVLMAASAVTAAILPDASKTKVAEGADNGTLRGAGQTNTLMTCIARDGAQSCNVTVGVGTTTTNGQGNSFTGDDNNLQTNTNTSQSALAGHPASSVVI